MAAPQLTPEMIGKRYVLLEKLGQGGMGIVHRASDRLTRQQVALKQVVVGADQLMFASRDTSTDTRLSLAREFQTLASLRHPNIITVADYGFDGLRQPYFTMELLSNAQDIITAGRGKLPHIQVGLLIQLLQALAYLHRRGIMHRDLKPSNILVTNGTVKVLDFGLSLAGGQRDDSIDSTAGTLPYMAPEVLRGDSSTPISDLYAVGMIAYELMIGFYPFSTGNLTELIEDILNTMPRVTFNTLDKKVAEVINRLLSKSPADRFQDAASVIEELSKTPRVTVEIETRSIRESYLQAAELVERERELTQLIEVFKAASAGHGAAWLIGGESGVGKSRLLEELRARALTQGATVLRGQAVSEGGNLYQVWRDVLRWLALFSDLDDAEAGVIKELVPDLPTMLNRTIPDAPALDPQATQNRLLAVIEAVFKRQTDPLVVILEDLHWAGAESLNVLDAIAKLSVTQPLLIIGSYRNDEQKDLPKHLPAMEVMILDRLSEAGIKTLSASMLGSAGQQKEIVDLLQRETEGNVFFLVEVVRALAEEAGQLDRVGMMTLPAKVLSGGVRTIVQRRLARVPDDQQAWLRLAAVFGRKLDLKVLRALGLGDGLESWLTLCNEAAVLDGSENQWRFAHDKLREGLLGQMSAEDRKMAHGRIGAALEKVYPDAEAQVTALAYHYSQADQWEKAAEYLIRAGDMANRLFAHLQARLDYQAALRALEKVPETDLSKRQRLDTVVKLVSISFSSESPDYNLKLLSEVEGFMAGQTADADRLRLARVHFWMGRSHYYKAETRTAIGYFQKVLGVAREFNDQELLITPANVIGQALIIQGQFGKAKAMLGTAVLPLEKSGNWTEWIRAVTFYGFALTANGQYDEGLAEVQRGLAKAQESNYLTGIGTGYLMLWLAHFMGDVQPTMLDESKMIISTAEQSGDMLYRYFGVGFRALTESRLGLHIEASATFKQLDIAASQIKGQIVLSDLFAFFAAEAALNAGEFAKALDMGEKAAVYCKTISTYTEGLSQRVWGMALAAQPTPNYDQAEEHMALSVSGLESSSAILEAARSRRAWGIICRDRGNAASAREQLQKALEQFTLSKLSHEVAWTQALIDGLP